MDEGEPGVEHGAPAGVGPGGERSKRQHEPVAVGSLATPHGEIFVAASSRGVCRIELPGRHAASRLRRWAHGIEVVDDSALLQAALRELREYFAGTRRRFTVPIDVHGTEFQRDVWDALLRIAYGTTTSYGAIARAIGEPGKARAVGAANGANPVAIIVPCHRVIGADGSLTGYGGGLPLKLWLLRHEGALIA
jgi:O-6-methylguanine DNA methyltransferase